MRIFSLKSLNQKSKIKPFRYKRDVLKNSEKIQYGLVFLPDEKFDLLEKKYKDKYSFIFRIKSFFRHIYFNLYFIFFKHKLFAKKNEQKRRYDTCLVCENMNKETDQCKICFCYLGKAKFAKTKLAYAKCPIDKW